MLLVRDTAYSVAKARDVPQFANAAFLSLNVLI